MSYLDANLVFVLLQVCDVHLAAEDGSATNLDTVFLLLLSPVDMGLFLSLDSDKSHICLPGML